MSKVSLAILIFAWLLAAVVAAILQGFHGNAEWAVGIAASLGTGGSVIGLVVEKALGEHADSTMPKTTPIKQLPPVTGDFVGRRSQQRTLRKSLRGGRHNGAATVIIITGRAGIGKTTLAIKAAYNLTRRFPDGQFYIDLRGAHSQLPLQPADVLAKFLTDLGVDPANVPSDRADRSRLFRQRVAGLRLLFIFDNAASTGQVRDLLPGDPSCAVIVTSRVKLADLDVAHMIELRELDGSHARELLESLIGPGRVNAEPDAADAIAASCGRLPLAVRIAGARLAAQPSWPLSRLAERLADNTRLIDELKFGDLAVRAALSFSYHAQSPQHQAAFRKLAIIGAPDFAAWPLATALECPIDEAERLLDELTENCLVESLGQDKAGQLRYRMHDIVREYSLECFNSEESQDQQTTALERICLATIAYATRAELELMPGTPTAGKAMAVAIIGVDWPSGLVRDPENWLTIEMTYVLHVLRSANQARLWTVVWELSEKLVSYLDPHAMWDDWQQTHDLALAAAKRSGSKLGEATILRNLAILHRLRGKSEAAETEANQALLCYAEIDDECGQADCRANLAWIYRRRGQVAAARADLLLAIAAFSSHSALRGEAWAYYMLADLEIERDAGVALSLAQKSVHIFGQAGDRRGRGWALRLCGDISRQSGLNPEALTAYSEAAKILLEVGDRRGSTRALGGMAGVYARTGRLSKAVGFYEECSVLFRELGDDRWELRVLRELHEIYVSMGKRRRIRTCIARENAIERRVGSIPLEPALRL